MTDSSTSTTREQQAERDWRPSRIPLPLLGACGCGAGCSCGCQSGGPCSCGGNCG